MSIVARNEPTQYELPNKGLQHGVLADIVGPFEEETPWGIKDKVRFIFELPQLQTEGNFAGERFRVVKKYTLSLHEKSNLSEDLESWFGRSISPEKRKEGIDLETLIGRKAGLVIVHKEDDSGRVWANVNTIIPPDATNTMTVSPGFVRDKDKTTNGDASANVYSQGDVSNGPPPQQAQSYRASTTMQQPQQPPAQPQTHAQVAPSPGQPAPAGTFPDDGLPF